MTLRRLLNVTYVMLVDGMAKPQRQQFDDWLATPLTEDPVDVANERAQEMLQRMMGGRAPAAPLEGNGS